MTGNRFSLVIDTLRERFADKDASEVFVWLDVFAARIFTTPSEPPRSQLGVVVHLLLAPPRWRLSSDFSLPPSSCFVVVRPQINQWDTDADLNNGQTLRDTIELSADTLVVLDPTGLPLRRLWCLYEISETPQEESRLQLLAHGADSSALAGLFEKA